MGVKPQCGSGAEPLARLRGKAHTKQECWVEPQRLNSLCDRTANVASKFAHFYILCNNADNGDTAQSAFVYESATGHMKSMHRYDSIIEPQQTIKYYNASLQEMAEQNLIKSQSKML